MRGDTKLGSAEGGATLDSKFPSLAALFNGSAEDDDVELLRDSNDIKITYFRTISTGDLYVSYFFKCS